MISFPFIKFFFHTYAGHKRWEFFFLKIEEKKKLFFFLPVSQKGFHNMGKNLTFPDKKF